MAASVTAHELGALSTFTEHEPAAEGGGPRGRFVLRRGYDRLLSGQRVLVVDDIVNTGHSIGQTIEAVRSATRTIDIDNVNRVLMQPHWQKETDLVDY